MVKRIVSSLLLMSVALTAVAAEPDLTQLKGQLGKVFGAQPDTLIKAPIDNFYEVGYGSKIYYVSLDGRYLLNGEVFDLTTRSNLTEERRAGTRLKALDALSPDDMIIYKAKEEKHVVTVFTDIDCGYCRKLHQGMAQMNDLGITVRYLAFPRAGLGSPSYDKAVSVWCAKDRNKAMDAAKANGPIEPIKCDAPVAKQWALGEQLGVNGTPALVLEDGKIMPGYAPPQQLLAILEQK